jgi:23S rRNA (cytidine1920-2'-O)/16S rRNA (cytidine1409-2'-O)-methyltransferase
LEFKLAKEQIVLKLLKEQFPSYTKEKLEALIACRQIKIGNESVVSLNQLFPSDSLITVIESKYVSRGGEKLEFALKEFNLKVDNLNSKAFV